MSEAFEADRAVYLKELASKEDSEEVYLRAYDSVSIARESLARYLTFYNTRRLHSSLDGQTPWLDTP